MRAASFNQNSNAQPYNTTRRINVSSENRIKIVGKIQRHQLSIRCALKSLSDFVRDDVVTTWARLANACMGPPENEQIEVIYVLRVR